MFSLALRIPKNVPDSSWHEVCLSTTKSALRCSLHGQCHFMSLRALDVHTLRQLFNLNRLYATQAMMEPGENWIDETYERKIELGPLPGWELPLDWTTPDITSDKKASTASIVTPSSSALFRPEHITTNHFFPSQRRYF